ncbi:TPA: LlaJI family restriction endonuclease [Vibrio parahaemolyticus]|uniref:LlaJI family restriction endonuclease n=1 Tax=Vibrio parahaemolyticus TaxID=670 RepID=UPI001E4468D1|nr:LlaJI family restriction endonuclease [Vibrio parahaemolyticus]HCE2128189.1 LlaJI family restriction endonuclease [Vibrio parahaemolyticus]HCE3220897.1 LlaJI family restriction endonuclease [Vibrio parahaemolyticus]HCM1038605.1 LlaJI family restriction endonuclease [Vibrio parahaemolyticus]
MKKNKILYLSDRDLLTDKKVPTQVLEELKTNGLIAPDMQKVHFCGVISFDDSLAVFLPRNYTNSDMSLDVAGRYLVRALTKYYRDKDTASYAQESGSQLLEGDSFSLATSILDDYCVNGLYSRRVTEKTINSGKVNWSRTISRSTPYPTQSGPIYLELNSSRARYVAHCETAKIHALVLTEIISKLGAVWLDTKISLDDNLKSISKPSGSTEVQVAYLRKELNLSYSERDILLIKNLIQYLTSRKGHERNGILIGVRKFHGLWEAMLDECLVGKYNVNNRLPIPVYQTVSDSFVSVSHKGQRTDTVLRYKDSNRFAVVDAKYYEASSPHNAPGWPDLVKQFYYQKMIAQLESSEAIVTNHFIFPGFPSSPTSVKAAYVAKRNIKITSSDDCLSEYPAIFCHYQDPLVLLQAYVDGEKLHNLTSIIFNERNM